MTSITDIRVHNRSGGGGAAGAQGNPIHSNKGFLRFRVSGFGS